MERVLFILLGCFVSSLAASDTLTYSNGEEIKGEFIRGTREAVYFEVGGSLLRVGKNKIEKIIFSRPENTTQFQSYPNVTFIGNLQEQLSNDSDFERFSLKLSKPVLYNGEKIVNAGAMLVGKLVSNAIELEYILDSAGVIKINDSKGTIINAKKMRHQGSKSAQIIKPVDSSVEPANNANYPAKEYLQKKSAEYIEKNKVRDLRLEDDFISIPAGAEVSLVVSNLSVRNVGSSGARF